MSDVEQAYRDAVLALRNARVKAQAAQELNATTRIAMEDAFEARDKAEVTRDKARRAYEATL